MAKFPIGIIYILRDKFQIYIPGFSSILEFRFLPEFIRDLDVINKELLFSLLELFIKNNKIPPTSFIIVIADSASIMKDFSDPSDPNIDEFLERVPFEEVASKKILLPNGIRAYGTNKDLYETIREFLAHVGSEVIFILPGIIIGPELRPYLDANGVNAILKKYPTLKECNLITQPALESTTCKEESKDEKEEKEIESVEISDEVKNEKKPDKKRMIILVSVFAILLVVLVIVYLNQPSLI